MSDALALAPSLRQRLPGWGTLASLLLHLGLAACILLLSPLRPLVVPPPQPVSVEIVTEQQYQAVEAPAPPVLATPAPAQDEAPPAPQSGVGTTPPSTATPKTDRGVVTATQFYAAAMLREPGMARIRATLGRIDPGERLVQLCNIEGLEQIRRADPGFSPDTLVAYAMADMTTTGFTLSATGGAFRSRRKWYRIAFQCTVAGDYSGVTAFSFKLGDAIPQDQWEAHDLNAEDADE